MVFLKAKVECSSNTEDTDLTQRRRGTLEKIGRNQLSRARDRVNGELGADVEGLRAFFVDALRMTNLL